MTKDELKSFLDSKVDLYEKYDFITDDPISIPHQFQRKEDIEIAAFLSATIAWGKRNMIINNANKMIALMGNDPYEFVCHASETQLDNLSDFKHRTFNGEDFRYFILALRNIYLHHGGLEKVFQKGAKGEKDMKKAISYFHEVFFEIPHPSRTRKHVSNPVKGSAAKRINMFLRWMVRPANQGVDFGLWKSISPAQLSCPLDVHSGNMARKLGILDRKQNDWKAVEALDAALRKMDPDDPVKYDFALFGLGVYEAL